VLSFLPKEKPAGRDRRTSAILRAGSVIPPVLCSLGLIYADYFRGTLFHFLPVIGPMNTPVFMQLAPAARHFSIMLSLFAPSIWHCAIDCVHDQAAAGELSPTAIARPNETAIDICERVIYLPANFRRFLAAALDDVEGHLVTLP
jgi:hypothetical protein